MNEDKDRYAQKMLRHVLTFDRAKLSSQMGSLCKGFTTAVEKEMMKTFSLGSGSGWVRGLGNL